MADFYSSTLPALLLAEAPEIFQFYCLLLSIRRPRSTQIVPNRIIYATHINLVYVLVIIICMSPSLTSRRSNFVLICIKSSFNTNNNFQQCKVISILKVRNK